MAEKEERIAIAKMIVNTDDEGSAKLDHFKIYSRQEAIERMAKAAYYNASTAPSNFPDWDKMEDEIGKEVKQGFIRFAEAALNALLEEK